MIALNDGIDAWLNVQITLRNHPVYSELRKSYERKRVEKCSNPSKNEDIVSRILFFVGMPFCLKKLGQKNFFQFDLSLNQPYQWK